MSDIKEIQIESGVRFTNGDNDDMLRAGGVRRIFPGWYTVSYRGVVPDNSTIVHAQRNRGGKIKQSGNNYQRR